MRTFLRYAHAALIALALTAPGTAATVTLSPSQDNTLYESPTGALSNGVGDYLFAGKTGPSAGEVLRRALVQFDVAAAIPSGATITSVTLKLNVSQAVTPDAVSANLHRVNAAWGEGSSDAGSPGGGGTPSTPGDATWIHRFHPTTLWTTPGGDFSGLSSAAATLGGVGTYTWGPTAAMVADAQAWLDNPTSNYGWMVRGEESSAGRAKRFDSRENSTVSVWPSLTVVYQEGGRLWTLPPCRAVDTRAADGPLGGPTLAGGVVRVFDLAGAACGIPTSVKALTLNITAVDPTGGGQLTLYPGDLGTPTNTAVVAFKAGGTRAAMLVVGLASDGTLAVFPTLSGEVDLLIDVTGYFQ